jgi:DNA-binding XRE family transcriptional regulator
MRKVRPPLSPGVVQALAELGAGLKDLRRRRRIPMTWAAERALISRSTLHKVERGDPAVSLGICATVLQGYGMVERLAVLAEARFDPEGLTLETGRLPGRIHRRASITSRSAGNP